MKVIVRTWNRMSRGYTENTNDWVVGAYEGLSFRHLPPGEQPASAHNFNNLRVTEIYMSAKEDALVVYCEQVDTKEEKA